MDNQNQYRLPRLSIGVCGCGGSSCWRWWASCSACSSRTSGMIKKRIEDLIQRDYLERDKDNANQYRYLA